MVEAGANEMPEAEILDALDIAHGEIRKLCAVQRELAEKAGKPKLEVTAPPIDEDLVRQISETHGAALDAATSVEDKLERQDATKARRGGGARAATPATRAPTPTASTAHAPSWRSTSSRSASSASGSQSTSAAPTAARPTRSA